MTASNLLDQPAGRPAIIAHGAGNTAALAQAAANQGADFVEVDLWVHRGRFEARHERRLAGPLPLLYEKWYLRFAPRRPFGLAPLLAQAAGATGVFLDLKGGGETAAELVRRSIAEASGHGPVVASSQQWRVLRALNDRCPEVRLFYSIDVQAKLDLLFSVARRDFLPRGVSCRHGLLTADAVHRLHDLGLLVVAWTVDDLDRAARLVDWGVDALTTHRVADFCQRFAP